MNDQLDALPTPKDIERMAFEADVTMTQLLERAGISQSTFARWKRGASSPTLRILERLIAAGQAAMQEKQNGEKRA